MAIMVGSFTLQLATADIHLCRRFACHRQTMALPHAWWQLSFVGWLGLRGARLIRDFFLLAISNYGTPYYYAALIAKRVDMTYDAVATS